MTYRGKKLKIRGKYRALIKPKIQGNNMKLSSNTGGKIHVQVVHYVYILIHNYIYPYILLYTLIYQFIRTKALLTSGNKLIF